MGQFCEQTNTRHILRDLRHRLHYAHRHQTNLGLELRRVHPAFFSSLMRYHPFTDDSFNYRLRFVVHYSLRQFMEICHNVLKHLW